MTYRIIAYPTREADIFSFVVDTETNVTSIPAEINGTKIVAGSIAYVTATGATFVLSLTGSWVKQPNA